MYKYKVLIYKIYKILYLFMEKWLPNQNALLGWVYWYQKCILHILLNDVADRRRMKLILKILMSK